MIKNFTKILIISQLIISCGFTPTLKNLDNNSALIHLEINPNNSYEVRQTINSELQSFDKSDAKFLIKVDVIEKESAVNVNSSGSVKEYKVEVLINFEIIDIANDVLLLSSQSRGFENYDVSTSEYTNTLVKKDALERALIEGIQLMNIIIHSKINKSLR